ncbi:EAL domain-containing protein [Marinicella rhabdoformis]|uniref:EAL domain-containing protein n=1 Tax=Marinicella rhabdoformis TaxID=2580566 RepID=UPI0015D045EF|nr:EAL domain-containing protein [Marinicella rhabdoformis]
MPYLDHNILIACDSKKDRLSFFNYFDNQQASQIFTASDMQQVLEILESEEQVQVLVIEISPRWLKGKAQIEAIHAKQLGIKIVGVFAETIQVDSEAYQTIDAWIDDSYFSPISQNELTARMGLDIKKISQHDVAQAKIVQLDTLVNLLFPVSAYPMFLYDVSDETVCYVNEQILTMTGLTEDKLLNKGYEQLAAYPNNISANQINRIVNERGSATLDFEVKTRLKKRSRLFASLNMQSLYLDGRPYYLGQLQNISQSVFYSQFVKKLKEFQLLDFSSVHIAEDMADLVKWTGVNFFFAVKKSANNYDEVVWDYSQDNMCELFVKAKHEFLIRKLQDANSLEIEHGAHRQIPGDEFVKFYSINSLMVYRCVVDKDSDIMVVAGGNDLLLDWEPTTLLFSELSDHYAKHMAFTALKASHESESQYDVLTGLINRRYIVKTIEQVMLDPKSQEDFKALVFLDLDRFKIINDSLGHDVGDSVLISVANVLKRFIGKHGVAARYAGDEFLIWLDDVEDKESVQKIATQVLQAVAHPIGLDNGSELKITVSMGIAYYPEHAKSVGHLIKNADTALYDAKLKGKNRFSEYTPSQEGESAKQLEEMEKNLSYAIDNNQLDVYFQPKIDAATEDIMGFEALVRWEHPELGIISPGLFIPLAEQTGLIHKIGYLVLHKSCKRLKQWQDEFGLMLNMSVNLSPLQLSDNKLIDRIKQVIKQSAIHPKYLDFEITESEKFEDVGDALKMMRKIVDLGCTLSIDDFGTGHSTLEYIRKIPAKTLKIDQTFVKNIGLSPDDEAILDATIDIAKRVGHKIVAEGVETEEQRHYLAAKGCEYFQGFLFCRPLPSADINEILKQRAVLLSNAG